MPPSERDREAVKRRAAYRCEYCGIPRSPRRRDPVEELDARENLAAACAHCNRLKGDFTTGRDPLTGREIRLFDPRRDVWEEHFAWSSDYVRLLPLSGIGEATIARLLMNAPVLRRQRQLLRQAIAGGGAPWP